MSAPIPFANRQASGQEVLAGGSPIAANVIIDQLGAIYRRPGIQAYAGATSAIVDANGLSGLYVTTDGAIYTVGASGAERPIYRVTTSGATKLGAGAPPYGLRGTLRPTFAETEMILVFAGGQEMELLVLATDLTSRVGGSSPFASHIIANASRLLGNIVTTNRTICAFSNTFNGDTSYAGALDWVPSPNGAGFIIAQARPDDIAAVYENTSEVYLFGTQTLEVFTPDQTQQYARVGVREVGCSAPYSVIKRDQGFWWLDDKRRFVSSDGRGLQVVSDPIKRTLESLSTISDCFGYRVVTGPVDCLVWQFPTDGRAFALQAGGGWSEWLGWDTGVGNWRNLIVSAHALRSDNFANLVATSSGYVGQLSLDAKTDLGAPVRAYIETGYVNRQTERYKECKQVTFRFRRGSTTSTTSPVARFGWRDRPGAWEADIPIRLGASGDTYPVVTFETLGNYRDRQWFFEFDSTADDLVLVSATEDFEVQP